MLTSNRREFLHMGASAALGAALAVKADAAPDHAQGEWRNKRDGMSYRRLGRTNLMISEIVAGGNEITPDNYKHIVEAFDRGLNYFDTAQAYGRGASEVGYGKAIQEVGRENVFVNTKASPWSRNRNGLLKEIFESLNEAEQKRLIGEAHDRLHERGALEPDHLCHYFGSQQSALETSMLSNVIEKKYGHKIDRPRNYKQLFIESIEASLKRLETDHVDLVMCPHGANSREEVTEFPEVFEAFDALKKAGKARFLGVSSHSDPRGVLEGAIDSGRYDMAMVAYNIVNKNWLNAALDKARKADVGVIAMKVARPVHHGRKNGRPNDPRRVELIQKWMPSDDLHLAQKCYLWALQDPRVAACNSNMVTRGQMEMNLAVAGRKVSV